MPENDTGRCSKCRHREHDGQWCWNMDSDNDCSCDLRATLTPAPVGDVSELVAAAQKRVDRLAELDIVSDSERYIVKLLAALTVQSAELAAAQTKLGEAEKVIAEAHDVTEYQDVTDGFARTWTARILATYTPTESTH